MGRIRALPRVMAGTQSQTSIKHSNLGDYPRPRLVSGRPVPSAWRTKGPDRSDSGGFHWTHVFNKCTQICVFHPPLPHPITQAAGFYWYCLFIDITGYYFVRGKTCLPYQESKLLSLENLFLNYVFVCLLSGCGIWSHDTVLICLWLNESCLFDIQILIRLSIHNVFGFMSFCDK